MKLFERIRRSWVLVLCAALTATHALSAPTPVRPTPAGTVSAPMKKLSARPNLVILLADDWGFSDVGSFGGEIATPHLDALARQGMRFSNFHVSASCSPTRAMLLTGVDNHRNGMGNMRETIPRSHLGQPGYLTVLNTQVVTVATLLRDSGYRTYASGKWHVGKEHHNLPDRRGFDQSIVQGDSGSDNWETGRRYLDLADKVYWFENGQEVVMPTDYYSSAYFVDRMLGFMQADVARAAQPFFAYLAFQANHIPLQAPKSFIDKYKGRYRAGWSVLRQERHQKAMALGVVPPHSKMVEMATTVRWDSLSAEQKAYEERKMEVYAAMAEPMDHHIGRFVEHLKQTGQYDNTVFVFLSDNGAEASDPYAVLSGRLWLDWQYQRGIDQLGAKGAYTVIGPSWASAMASPLSTYKFYSGEGGIRVPMIVSGVPGMQRNRIHPSFSHVNDVAPTLLALAGVPQPGTQYQGQSIEPMTGRSLLPVLYGHSERVYPVDEPIGYELSGNQALFKGDLKLIKNIPPIGDGQWHLYDIVNDPGETQDLKERMPEAFALMQAQYATYAQANGVLPMPEGYDPMWQVQVNAFFNVYVDRLKWPVLAFRVVVLFLGGWYWRRRQHLHRA